MATSSALISPVSLAVSTRSNTRRPSSRDVTLIMTTFKFPTIPSFAPGNDRSSIGTKSKSKSMKPITDQ